MPYTMSPFAIRLSAAIREHSPLCVGIDPAASLLKRCGLPDSAAGAFEFGKRVLEAAQFQLAIIKPQSAFFERFGSPGIQAMEQLVNLARSQQVLVLLDGKRGDIDTTAEAYAEGYFTQASTLQVDAVTVHAYLGFAALEKFLTIALQNGGGVFVVVRSSNPEGHALQNAKLVSGETVAQHLASAIVARNRIASDEPIGPIGAVVGATCDDAAETVTHLPGAFILAPGVGAQGASIQDVLTRMSAARGRVLPSVSRAIVANGSALSDMRSTIRALKEEARQLL